MTCNYCDCRLCTHPHTDSRIPAPLSGLRDSNHRVTVSERSHHPRSHWKPVHYSGLCVHCLIAIKRHHLWMCWCFSCAGGCSNQRAKRHLSSRVWEQRGKSNNYIVLTSRGRERGHGNVKSGLKCLKQIVQNIFRKEGPTCDTFIESHSLSFFISIVVISNLHFPLSQKHPLLWWRRRWWWRRKPLKKKASLNCVLFHD